MQHAAIPAPAALGGPPPPQAIAANAPISAQNAVDWVIYAMSAAKQVRRVWHVHLQETLVHNCMTAYSQ